MVHPYCGILQSSWKEWSSLCNDKILFVLMKSYLVVHLNEKTKEWYVPIYITKVYFYVCICKGRESLESLGIYVPDWPPLGKGMGSTGRRPVTLLLFPIFPYAIRNILNYFHITRFQRHFYLAKKKFNEPVPLQIFPLKFVKVVL